MAVRAWVGVVVVGLVAGVGACGSDDDDEAGASGTSLIAGDDGGADGGPSSTEPAASGDEATCVDEVGDASVMLGQSAGDVTLGAADLAEVVVRRTAAGLEVVGTFAEEHTAGTRSFKVVLQSEAGAYPNADVMGRQSEGLEPEALVTRRPDQGTLEDGTGTVVVEGPVVTVTVDAAELGSVLGGPWRWEATSTAGLSGEIGQDACGSLDAGAGSEIVYFPGPGG